MTCGSVIRTWPGPGKSWEHPNGFNVRGGNQNPRWQPIDYGLSSAVMMNSHKNNISSGLQHAGVDSAALEHGGMPNGKLA